MKNIGKIIALSIGCMSLSTNQDPSINFIKTRESDDNEFNLALEKKKKKKGYKKREEDYKSKVNIRGCLKNHKS